MLITCMLNIEKREINKWKEDVYLEIFHNVKSKIKKTAFAIQEMQYPFSYTVWLLCKTLWQLIEFHLLQLQISLYKMIKQSIENLWFLKWYKTAYHSDIFSQ